MLNTCIDCGNTTVTRKNPHVITKKEALDAAIQLYQYCLEKKIPFDGRISPYFCSPVCSQLGHTLFIGDDDTVKACPGGPVLGKYGRGKLKELFDNSPFRKEYAGVTHNPCISRKGKHLHNDFEERVKASL